MSDASPDISDYAARSLTGDLNLPGAPGFPTGPVGAAAGNIARNYAQDVASGNIAARGLNAMTPPYDPSKSFAQNALNPQGIQNAADIAMGFSGGGLGIKAYHGSPYNFDRFDISKIGTGQGASMFSPGLYFAEHEPVATGYRDMLSEQQDYGVSDESGTIPSWVANYLLQKGGNYSGAGTFASRADNMIREFSGRLQEEQRRLNVSTQPWNVKDRIANVTGILDRLQRLKSGLITLKAPGHMYEVNIKSDPATFIDWYRPFSAQTPEVQRALGGRMASWVKNDPQSMGETITRAGKTAYGAADMFNMGEFPKSMTPLEISQRLRDDGISGVRYPDQGSRPDPALLRSEIDYYKSKLAEGGAQGSPTLRAEYEKAIREREEQLQRGPTHNYVMYDDKLIDILRKYGITGLTTLGAGAALAGGGDGGS